MTTLPGRPMRCGHHSIYLAIPKQIGLPQSAERSRQVGLLATIKAIFFARVQHIDEMTLPGISVLHAWQLHRGP